MTGGGYQCRGGAVFAIGDTLIAEDNLFENCHGGYYGGAVFVTGGALGGLECGQTGRQAWLPCEPALGQFERNIFRDCFAQFGGALQVTIGGNKAPPGTWVPGYPRTKLILIENLFTGNMSRDYVAGLHPHSGGYAVYSGTEEFEITRNTFVSNNQGHNFEVRNTGTLAFPYAVSPNSYCRENIFAFNRGGGVTFDCTQGGFFNIPMMFDHNVL